MKIVVQKFGGTSLASSKGREEALRHIVETRKNGFHVVVVVSAMGRFPDPYATDTFLQLIRNESKPKHRDLLLSCGEVVSVAVMADLLESHGISSDTLAFVQTGILTTNQHGDGQILEIDVAPILSALERGEVVVIPGFQGVTRDGQITTLGRGGSDTTAAALGAALKAELVEIYTDVEGIFSADPRLVPDAHVIEEITFAEVGEMAHHGAKVLHPKAVSFAMASSTPIRIRSTASDKPGTLVTPNPVKFDDSVTAITHIPKSAYVQIELDDDESLDQSRHTLFKLFAEAGVSLDLITVSGHTVSFIIQESQVNLAKQLLKPLDWPYQLEKGFAKVSVVGAGIRGRPGVMYKIIDTLHRAGISLYHSTDSHITIACLVKQADMEKAIRLLHDEFVHSD